VPDPTEAVWRISSTRKNATKTIVALRHAQLRLSKRKAMVPSSSKSTTAPIAEHARQCATSRRFIPRNKLWEKQPARNHPPCYRASRPSGAQGKDLSDNDLSGVGRECYTRPKCGRITPLGNRRFGLSGFPAAPARTAGLTARFSLAMTIP
jgi:hypothetical protein